MEKTNESRLYGEQPGVRLKLFIADETIGVGKINLLELVGQVGSISGAARKLGMSYRRAWFLLNSLQSGFSSQLFITERGGTSKGGAKLTALGYELIDRYRHHSKVVQIHSGEILDWMRSVQARPSKPPH